MKKRTARKQLHKKKEAKDMTFVATVGFIAALILLMSFLWLKQKNESEAVYGVTQPIYTISPASNK